MTSVIYNTMMTEIDNVEQAAVTSKVVADTAKKTADTTKELAVTTKEVESKVNEAEAKVKEAEVKVKEAEENKNIIKLLKSSVDYLINDTKFDDEFDDITKDIKNIVQELISPTLPQLDIIEIACNIIIKVARIILLNIDYLRVSFKFVNSLSLNDTENIFNENSLKPDQDKIKKLKDNIDTILKTNKNYNSVKKNTLLQEIGKINKKILSDNTSLLKDTTKQTLIIQKFIFDNVKTITDSIKTYPNPIKINDDKTIANEKTAIQVDPNDKLSKLFTIDFTNDKIKFKFTLNEINKTYKNNIKLNDLIDDLIDSKKLLFYQLIKYKIIEHFSKSKVSLKLEKIIKKLNDKIDNIKLVLNTQPIAGTSKYLKYKMKYYNLKMANQ